MKSVLITSVLLFLATSSPVLLGQSSPSQQNEPTAEEPEISPSSNVRSLSEVDADTVRMALGRPSREEERLRDEASLWKVYGLIITFALIGCVVFYAARKRGATAQTVSATPSAGAPPSNPLPQSSAASSSGATQLFDQTISALTSIDQQISPIAKDLGIVWPVLADEFRQSPDLDAIEEAREDLTQLTNSRQKCDLIKAAILLVEDDFYTLPKAFDADDVDDLEDAPDLLVALATKHLPQREWVAYAHAVARTTTFIWSLSPIENALMRLKLERDDLTHEKIKEARRHLARRVHSDLGHGGDEAMTQVNSAADLLIEYLKVKEGEQKATA